MMENNPNIRFRKKSLEPNMDIAIDIDKLEDTSSMMYNTIREWWESSYLSDLDPDENIPAITEQWESKYVNTPMVKEAIQKIKDANPPEEITIKLSIDLLTHDNFIKLEDDINDIPFFRPYIKPQHRNEFPLDTYAYDPTKKKFESLEIVDQETLIDEGFSPETINNFYSFHQRLMETSSKKLRLHTSQPSERIDEWNKQGFIPQNTYFTDNYQRAEYYFNPAENDVIVTYRISENQLLMTSDAFGAKEYVTLNYVKIE